MELEIGALLIACWALFFALAHYEKREYWLCIFPFVISLFMFGVLDWIAVLFFAVSLYYMAMTLVEHI